MLLAKGFQCVLPFTALLLIGRATAADAPHAAGVTPIAINATPEQMSAAVSNVRAGRKLAFKLWPAGARVAVALSFDIDNETWWRDNPLPVPLSEGEYGALEALPRILSLLDREALPATFFIPAMSAILHPEMIPEIAKRKRHEIGVHGWVHEGPSMIGDPVKEEELLNRAIAYLTRVTGKRPIGYRAPSWDFSPYTLDAINKAGFLYDSSMMARDEPYELLSKGKPTHVIELPPNWIGDDYPYYEPRASGSLPSPDAVFTIYRDEFDAAYAEGTLFILSLHPQVTGRRSRVAVLERLIDYMKSKPGVWFATLGDIANYVKQQDSRQ
jgi:peptidoglycan/xylan/chitin deacetylase (PgdA/CDA1 family)